MERNSIQEADGVAALVGDVGGVTSFMALFRQAENQRVTTSEIIIRSTSSNPLAPLFCAAAFRGLETERSQALIRGRVDGKPQSWVIWCVWEEVWERKTSATLRDFSSSRSQGLQVNRTSPLHSR